MKIILPKHLSKQAKTPVDKSVVLSFLERVTRTTESGGGMSAAYINRGSVVSETDVEQFYNFCIINSVYRDALEPVSVTEDLCECSVEGREAYEKWIVSKTF